MGEAEFESSEKNSRGDVAPNKELVACYQAFQEALHPKVDTVYYPGCDLDTSPSAAFPDSRVIYVDVNEYSVDHLQRAGLEAHKASVDEFDPGSVDVLILLNFSIDPVLSARLVKEKGYVLCNDYNGTASQIFKDEKFSLKAIITNKTGEKPHFDSDDPEQYWQTVATEEELRKSPAYESIAKRVEQITGKRENIFAEYTRLIQEAEQQQEELLREHPELKDGMPHYMRDGKIYTLFPPLPPKKGTNADIFVFEKPNSLKK